MKINGTTAKDIALYFFLATDVRYTSSMIAKTINQVKALLEAGYTLQEIKDSIDYIVTKTSIQMYSLGYLSTSINSILEKLNKEKKELEVKETIERQKEVYDTIKREVDVNDSSEERNRSKVERFGIQPRFGTESDFDMLKK